MKGKTRKPIWEYKIRTCLTMHECSVCRKQIRLGDRYFDGGYGYRAHVLCVEHLKDGNGAAL